MSGKVPLIVFSLSLSVSTVPASGGSVPRVAYCCTGCDVAGVG